VLVELRKSFTNYGPNKRRSCNWVVSHLRITEFYAKQTATRINKSCILFKAKQRFFFFFPPSFWVLGVEGGQESERKAPRRGRGEGKLKLRSRSRVLICKAYIYI